MKIMHYIFCLLLSTTVSTAMNDVDENGGIYNHYDESDWIDPHDILANRQTTPEQSNTLDSSKMSNECEKSLKDVENCRNELRAVRDQLINCEIEEPSIVVQEMTYFKQLVSSFLDMAESQDGYVFAAYVSMSSEDRNRAMSLMHGNDVKDVNKVLDTLQYAFKPLSSSPWKQASELFTWPVFIGAVGLNVLMFLGLFLQRQVQLAQSWRRTILMTFLVLFFVSIPIEWYRLYKVELAKKTATVMKDIPETCYPNNLTPWKSVKLWFVDTFTTFDDECATYHQSILVDPFLEVSPLQATAVCASRFFLEPIKQFASALGISFRLLFKEVPLQWQPIVFLFIVIVVIFLLMAKTGFEISSPLLRIGFRREPVANVRLRELENENQQLREERLALDGQRLAINQPIDDEDNRYEGVQQVPPAVRPPSNHGARSVRRRVPVDNVNPSRKFVGNVDNRPSTRPRQVTRANQQQFSEQEDVIESLENLNINETERASDVNGDSNERHQSTDLDDVASSREAVFSSTPLRRSDVSVADSRNTGVSDNTGTPQRGLTNIALPLSGVTFEASSVNYINSAESSFVPRSSPSEHDELEHFSRGLGIESVPNNDIHPTQESSDIKRTKCQVDEVMVVGAPSSSDSEYEIVNRENWNF